jgi:hypothetical protein
MSTGKRKHKTKTKAWNYVLKYFPLTATKPKPKLKETPDPVGIIIILSKYTVYFTVKKLK